MTHILDLMPVPKKTLEWKRRSDANRARFSGENGAAERQRRSEMATRQWQNPAHRERMLPVLASNSRNPVALAKRAVIARRQIKLRREELNASFRTPTAIHNRSSATRSRWADPAWRERQCRLMREGRQRQLAKRGAA